LEIKVVSGDIAKTKADAVIVNYFEGHDSPGGETSSLDAALDGAISLLIKQGEIKGKCNEVTIIHSLGKLPADRVVVVGLGKQSELTLDKVRGAMSAACRLLRRKNVSVIATVTQGSGLAGIVPESSAQALSEGALLGIYAFRRHITKEADQGEITSLTLVSRDKNALPVIRRGVKKGIILSEATNLARDMVNEPGNYMTPTIMAEIASRVADTYGLEIDIFEKEQVQEMGMGAFLAVSRASVQPPKFIVLNYKGGKSGATDIALVGKGITFDTGGISLKSNESMVDQDMKGDMAGGAAVIAAMTAIARLKPKINVLAVVAATENMPGGNALKPQDIVTAMNGKTIEITSTDAEGRLTLADALSYARQQDSRLLIDIATLTGAVQAALGDACSGGFTNNQEFLDRVIAAGDEAGERIWQLPMYEEYKDQNKSEVADIKNTGGKLAGAITAAQFLSEFVGDTRWVHLDIAGTFFSDKERKHLVRGATGIPVRTLVNLVVSLAK
jgi:leucyl aminopeptidase